MKMKEIKANYNEHKDTRKNKNDKHQKRNRKQALNGFGTIRRIRGDTS